MPTSRMASKTATAAKEAPLLTAVAAFAVFAAMASLATPPAQAAEPWIPYSPPSNAFTCRIPGSWWGYEEEEPNGFAVHLLSPDDPLGVYRAGIDVHRVIKGTPGYAHYREEISKMRKGGGLLDNQSSPLSYTRAAGGLGIVFETTDWQWLAVGRLPARRIPLHHWVCVVAEGENYWIIRLSSTRASFLKYRDLFRRFVSSFKSLGG